MGKKIFYLFLIFLFIIPTTLYSVSSGNENDPEILDDEYDLISGRKEIIIPRILYPFFKNIDIISCWFYENQDNPDILYVSLKLKTYEYKPFNTRYMVWWSYQNVDYIAGLITYSNGEFEVGISGYIDENGTEQLQPVSYLIDKDLGIITFNIPKEIIGNPNVGEELLDPWTWTGCNFQNEFLAKLWKWELAKDYTFDFNGRPYVIKY